MSGSTEYYEKPRLDFYRKPLTHMECLRAKEIRIVVLLEERICNKNLLMPHQNKKYFEIFCRKIKYFWAKNQFAP